MRRDLLRALRVVAPATIALLVVAGAAPGRLELALRIYGLLMAGVVIVLALLALRRAIPPETPLEIHEARRVRAQPPVSLARMEDHVVLGIASSFDLHTRLVPRLRAIASGLLAARRGVSLTASPDRARDILGDETWELVRPDRPAPQDRLTTGIDQRELARVVDTLEAL